jgi:hypothetical protein
MNSRWSFPNHIDDIPRTHEMPFRRPSLQRRRSAARRLTFFFVLMFVPAMAILIPLTQADATAVTQFKQSQFRHFSAPQSISSPQAPGQTQAPRLSVLVGETRDINKTVPMTSVLVVSPEIASAVLNGRSLRLTGLHIGETILIAFDGLRRQIFIVEVIGRTYATTHRNLAPANSSAVEQHGFSGSYALSYSAPFGGGPTLLRQSFDFQRKLIGGRTLRFSSDMFKLIGKGDPNRGRVIAPGLGLNRISLGLDTSTTALDILDSQINVSPLSFNGYTMRGFHLVSTPGSPLRGTEFFSGLARPSLSLFDMNQGRLTGVVLPIAQGEFWQVRAGIFSVSPQQNNKLGSGGTVWHLDGRYAPSKMLAAEGEVAYANGGLSWRGRLDLQSRTFIAYAEILRLDRRSPLVSIGAQGGGRQTQAFALHWLASKRFSTSLSYDHTAIAPPATSLRASFGSTTLSGNATYQINQNSRLALRYVQQQIETGTPANGSRFRLETRTVGVGHDIRFNKRWADSFDARLYSSRETRADAGTDSGLSLNDQLHFSFKGGSATGFVNYARQKQSLAGLIFRNPQLLPPVLQRAFAADPALFLLTYRDTLGLLLPGVELPQTRGLDTGLRIQAALSRINFAGELHYSSAEFLGRNQQNVVASASLNARLDAANSVQVSGSRSFASNAAAGQSTLTISYVHRFGAGSGGGFQFSRLLGLDRGLIQGRVFSDLNGNGHDDPNEPGVAGMTVQIEGGRSTTSDEQGRFRFQLNPGEYNVAIISDRLGVQLSATTPTEQHVSLLSRQKVNVSFGVSSFGSLAGRIFNDLLLEGEQTAGSFPGVAGIHLSLRSAGGTGAPLSLIVDQNGGYQFRNLPPGSYILEIDPATLPADFRILKQTSWVVTIEPLQNFYLDVALSAQRAVSGVVFVDKDGDGKFDPEKDETVEGASVIVGKTEVISGRGGAYILRNIPSGKISVRARAPWGAQSLAVTIELGDEPTSRKGVNLAVTH